MSGILWLFLALALHVWPGVVKPAHGQGSRKDDIVFNTRGVPLAGATVRVCAMPATGQPCTPLALIYSDPGLTQALANPTATDGLGNYFAAPGKYEIEISGPNITTKQIPNVILPSDPSSPTFSSISSTGGISAFSLTLTGNLTVNGSTSVVGNLASGTLTLSNQGTPPGAAGAGTVNLYTKTADKRLYYKDETGTEVGPITTASGAQTNQPNTFTAPQNIDADFHTKGLNPWLDITRYGGYIGPNYRLPTTTCSINASSTTATCAAASDFVNGNGILILGAGPAPVIATPTVPTVTTLFQTGSTTRTYCVADRDWAGGLTPCGPAGNTTTAPASLSLASYSISSWSWNQASQTMTITTSSAHNMPTSASGISSEPYAQVEIQSGSTGNGACEGAFSLTAVPSATTLQFQRNELTTNPNCSGGTLRIAPELMLKWDSHYTYNVQSASCSGGVATIVLSPGIYGPGGTVASTWVVPWGVKAIVTGVSDSHYNGNQSIYSYSPNGSNVSFTLNCSGVTNVGAGGTLSIVPGKAVKNHLIYECTGSSCALPANAANYSLVGVAQGNDGFFIDRGWGASPASVDAGDAPRTAPTSALNEYLDTTITAGGGTTTLTLATAASTAVSSAKAWHDNVPNLLAACAAIPANVSAANSGHIVVPSTNSLYQFFPMIANFDMVGAYGQNPRNCPGVTIDFGPTTWLDGAILLGKGHNLQGGFGGTNCTAAFYIIGQTLSCFQGNSYPMVYFEPEQASGNWFKDVEFNPNQSYQTGLLIDEQMDGDGTVSLRFDNAHVNGGIHSYPIIDRAGFGQFWNYGGWGNQGGNFSESIGFLFQPLCGMPAYQPPALPPMPYIITTNSSYSFGVMKIDSCGMSPGTFGSNVVFNNVLTEGPAGPAVKVNLLPYGLAGITFNQGDYSDFTGGSATPYFDLTNSTVSSAEFLYTSCADPSQPLLQTNSANSYNGIHVKLPQGACSAGIGYPANASVVYENLTNALAIWNGIQLSLAGSGKLTAGQIANPTVAPTVTVSTTCSGHPSAGTYTYGVVAWDASSNVAAGTGGSTKVGPASSGVTLDGATQCAVITQPVLPAGTAYWGVVRLSGPGSINQVYAGNGSNGVNSFLPVSSFPTIVDQIASTAGSQPPVNNSSLQLVTPAGVFGNVQGSTIGTIFNCSSTVSPAACGSAPAGLVQVAASASTLTVKTTVVTANSRFAFTYVTTGTGCSTAPTNIASLLPPYVSAITAGTSFTITLPVAPATNPACISFTLEN